MSVDEYNVVLFSLFDVSDAICYYLPVRHPFDQGHTHIPPTLTCAP
jgi:hypothetical protein